MKAQMVKTIFALATLTNQKSNGNGYNHNQNGYNHNQNRGRGRGNFNNRGDKGRRGSSGQSPQFSPFNHFQQGQSSFGGVKLDRPICQICGKVGHLAVDCYHRVDYAYQGKHPPAKLAAMATASNARFTQNQPWLIDSTATDHVTASLNQLSFPKPHTTQDHITVGNGQTLPITHIGTTLIPSSFSSLQLHNVLRVPSIASNLAFIQKLCHDNNC